ncbi:MAG TPA: DUF1398 family protein [Panacibacter sp.]|nr:DUF1398 family protein [Panacibacter sp.]
MFTIDQIKEVHSRVKTGADFPNYIQDLIKLGVNGYDTFVSDGHSVYFGNDNYSIRSDAKYTALEVAEKSDKEKFQHSLKIHQQGQTDYPTFCKHSAETGVEKWTVDMNEMSCTYYDKAGNKLLTEVIPSA